MSLALSRKIGEHIVIDGNIMVKVVSVKGETVKLSIDAPKHIKVYRSEIYQLIVEENKAAMSNLKLPSFLKPYL